MIHLAYLFDKSCQYDVIFGANFLDMFDVTINYNETILQWMDLEISIKNFDKFFNTNMSIDLNNKLCYDKDDNMFE